MAAVNLSQSDWQISKSSPGRRLKALAWASACEGAKQPFGGLGGTVYARCARAGTTFQAFLPSIFIFPP